MALKLALMYPALFADFKRFTGDPYEKDIPDWTLDYADAQRGLGLYPMTGPEGDAMRVACFKLMGLPFPSLSGERKKREDRQAALRHPEP